MSNDLCLVLRRQCLGLRQKLEMVKKSIGVGVDDEIAKDSVYYDVVKSTLSKSNS